ncbi:toprim domain-containing protein [Prosthecochloris sp.]|uniref:toprim domain-containing protein n=1 Tax=Prosthecochloris sp. TaxID=290513 RepID=UPI00257A78CF|nr:toprim domain-containing protein [Prosthecochloris sp.]
MAFRRTWPVSSSSYLEERGITAATLRDFRFRGRVRTDRKGNVVFLYYDRQGLCGFEMKNRGYTGFSKHGAKGLWTSRAVPSDNRLVLAESPIDALSYHQLHGDARTRYISMGGQYREEQKEMVVSAMKHMSAGSTVLMAFDNDTQGRVFADEFTRLAPEHVGVIRALPETRKDWNDQLRAMMGPGQSGRRAKDPCRARGRAFVPSGSSFRRWR